MSFRIIRSVTFQLQEREDPLGNIYVRIMICPAENTVSCNAFLYESWGAVEEFSVDDNLFAPGADFDFSIEIKVTAEQFDVSMEVAFVK